ncbi:enoyl-CoA hydratase/isomerase family protein, partial [Pseudomonas aeruginosa]
RHAGLLCGRSQDGAEALQASVERRTPRFTGQ